jgi:hypothetical protein
VGGLGGGGED